MNQKTTTANNGGWPRRWWERMFAVVLVLIAVIAAIILFLIMARGYCECRTWSEWTAGSPCPEGCSAAQTPSDWNQDALLYCRKQLGSYSAADVFDLPGATQVPATHERYFMYQSPSSAEVYFFLAVQASSYGDPSLSSQRPIIDLRVAPVDLAGGGIERYPVSCSGPRLISEASTGSTGGNSDRTWGWYCRVSAPQGYSGGNGSSYGGSGYGGGFAGYRVFVSNKSPQALRYCYVAVCDRRYPKNDRCTDPAVALQIQGTPSRGGYPSSNPSYSPAYPVPPTSLSPPPSSSTGQ